MTNTFWGAVREERHLATHQLMKGNAMYPNGGVSDVRLGECLDASTISVVNEQYQFTPFSFVFATFQYIGLPDTCVIVEWVHEGQTRELEHLYLAVAGNGCGWALLENARGLPIGKWEIRLRLNGSVIISRSFMVCPDIHPELKGQIS